MTASKLQLRAYSESIEATQKALERTATELRDAAQQAVLITGYDAAESDFTFLSWVEDMTFITTELQRLKNRLAYLKEKRESLRQSVGDED